MSIMQSVGKLTWWPQCVKGCSSSKLYVIGHVIGGMVIVYPHLKNV